MKHWEWLAPKYLFWVKFLCDSVLSSFLSHQNRKMLSTLLLHLHSYLLHIFNEIFTSNDFCREHQLPRENVWKFCMWFCIAIFWSSERSNFNKYSTVHSLHTILQCIVGDKSFHRKFTAGIWMWIYEGSMHYFCDRNQVNILHMTVEFCVRAKWIEIFQISSETKIRGVLVSMSSIAITSAPLIVFSLSLVTSWRNISLYWCIIQSFTTVALFCVSKLWIWPVLLFAFRFWMNIHFVHRFPNHRSGCYQRNVKNLH